jgi:sugar (pentulose or hexulose) kinase
VEGLLHRIVEALDEPGAIGAISVASVGEEVVLLDDTGQPVGDSIAWYDPRGTQEAAAYLSGPGGALPVSEQWPPHPTFSLFKLMWLHQHRASDMAAARSWIDLGGYVLAGLGGAPVVDWTHASRAGAFDLLERDWDAPSIATAGLALDFPELVPSGTVIGAVTPAAAARTGLPAGAAIVSGGHDHLCAAFGAGVRSGAELFLSAGTSEAHLALLAHPRQRSDAASSVELGCYVDARSYYAHVNIHSGHVYRQWRSLLYLGESDETIAAEVELANVEDGPTFTLVDGQRLGRLDRISYEADRAALMRAVAEGLARRSADIIDELELVTGSPFALILAAGHPTRDPLWKQLRLAAYHRPMAAVDEPESAAFGAAVIAARAVAGPAAHHLVARRTAWP